MAYGYFPTNYNPFPQPMQYQVPQMMQQTQQSNLIHVQSENQAREWRVDLGSSVMFIDDNAPFIYTKTAGSSQLEPAVFKRFKRVSDFTHEPRPLIEARVFLLSPISSNIVVVLMPFSLAIDLIVETVLFTSYIKTLLSLCK